MTDVNLKIRHAKRQNAQNLDLKDCKLESIPIEVFQLKTLLNLNLSNNKLTSVDKSIENLKNLTEFNIENNSISSLPEEILSLPNLKYLRLINNPIYDQLQDYNLNWKESVREFLYKKEEISQDLEIKKTDEKNENISSTGCILNNQNLPSQNKKVPFTINSGLKVNLFNHTLGNFNLIKRDSLTAESNQPQINDTKKISLVSEGTCNIFPLKERENLMLSSNHINNINKIRIPSGNINKKLSMNTILKNRKSVNSDKEGFENHENCDNQTKLKKLENRENSSNLFKEPKDKEKDDYLLLEYKLKEQNEEMEKLKNKIENLQIELKQTKQLNFNIEEDYKNNLKLLEGEIKILKNKGMEKNVENIITSKRNWMENSSISNPVISGSSGLSGLSSNLIGSSIQNKIHEDYETKIKELENQLQKENLSNKRFKNEVDRLNQQLTLTKQSHNLSGENILKNVQEINYDEIKIENKIGQGGFSMIYKGEWNSLPVAVKIIFDPNITEELLNEFNNEIKMLFMLRHPNIILLIGISSKPQKLAIISEYVENGSLFDLLHRSNKEITNNSKLKIILQLIRALSYIHMNGIVHRDIKSHNVLIDENLNVKLCDFGLAKNKHELNIGPGQFSGTPAYMAPELFLKKAYDEKIDLFSFGTLMWEILVRKIPFDGYEVSEIKSKVLSDESLFIPKNIPIILGNIINSCRLLDSTKRPIFSDLSKIKILEIKF